MEKTEVMLESFLLGAALGFVCKLYFGMAAEPRRWKRQWFGHTMIPVFTLGILVIAFSEIPPYIL